MFLMFSEIVRMVSHEVAANPKVECTEKELGKFVSYFSILISMEKIHISRAALSPG